MSPKGFISGQISIQIGYDLGIRNQLDFDFIPGYVREQRNCDFITIEEALEIGTSEKVKAGIGPMLAELNYDGTLKKYIWKVGSFLTREGEGLDIHGETDMVEIDAITKKVLSHQTRYYGPLR